MLLRLLACSDVVLQAEVYEVLRRLIKVGSEELLPKILKETLIIVLKLNMSIPLFIQITLLYLNSCLITFDRCLLFFFQGTLNIEKFVVKSDASDLNILDCLLDARIFYEIIAFGFSSLEMQVRLI